MSRRQSLFKKKNPGKPRVRFPDELVFQDSVKENDVEQMDQMLRRASLKVDINSINSAGIQKRVQFAGLMRVSQCPPRGSIFMPDFGGFQKCDSHGTSLQPISTIIHVLLSYKYHYSKEFQLWLQ